MNVIDLREKKIKSNPNLRMHPNDPNKREWMGNVGMSELQEETQSPQKAEAAPERTNPLLPIAWEAEEFEYHHKDGTWFLSAGIIGMAILAFAVITRNFLMIPLIFIFAFVIYVFSVKKPRMMEFEISDDGMAMRPVGAENIAGNGKFFPFKDISSFWIFQRNNGRDELSFETDKLLYPHLKIPLPEEIDVKRLREVLLGFIEEKEQDESLSEILAGWLRF